MAYTKSWRVMHERTGLEPVLITTMWENEKQRFEVFANSCFIGCVYPFNEENKEEIVGLLDDGKNPVSDSWYDGVGEICTIDGWGDAVGYRVNMYMGLFDSIYDAEEGMAIRKSDYIGEIKCFNKLAHASDFVDENCSQKVKVGDKIMMIEFGIVKVWFDTDGNETGYEPKIIETSTLE